MVEVWCAARRGGGRVTLPGRASSTTVGLFRLPPRAIVFHPAVAVHALSRAPENSWQLPYRPSDFFARALRSTDSIGAPSVEFRRCGGKGSSLTILYTTVVRCSPVYGFSPVSIS